MAAPKGNAFWQLRSKHGRDKLFASPELLWQAATEYFAYIDQNPWEKNEAIKSGDLAGQIVKVPTARPYTLSGFALYIGASESYWKEFRKNDKLSEDFLSVITRVEEVIRTHKFEGAAVGAFNANIMVRDLGMVDKTDVTSLGNEIKSGTTVVKTTLKLT